MGGAAAREPVRRQGDLHGGVEVRSVGAELPVGQQGLREGDDEMA
jgi:hypothetical protein